MPTVTYPSHTTLATGVVPGTHGITGNAVFDPLGNRDGEWFWYEEEIRVPTLWGVARGHGLRTALIGWPVTMGARADAVVPEFWRGRGIDVARLLRAISTPGLLDDVAREFPDFYAGLTPPVTKDESLADVAIHVIRHERPNLLMLHLSAVDHWQHEKGPWSPEALAAIENADGQIARVLDAAQMAGILEQTLVAIVSDHGFARQQKVLRPAVLLRQKGLITLDEKNRVKSWRAQVATSGGSAYVYVKDASDAEAQNAVMELFRGLSGQPGSGIARVFTREQIAALGGDPEAFLAIEAAEGFGFILGASGDAVADATVPGLHGFPSDREDMRSSLILRGPEVGAGRIEGVRMVDVAPTVARWLGLRLEKAEGKPLVLPARAKSSREKPLEQKRDPTPK
jgi:predicted AlkP superfamily pyrophosphatase or phosphodiesterase